MDLTGSEFLSAWRHLCAVQEVEIREVPGLVSLDAKEPLWKED